MVSIVCCFVCIVYIVCIDVSWLIWNQHGCWWLAHSASLHDAGMCVFICLCVCVCARTFLRNVFHTLFRIQSFLLLRQCGNFCSFLALKFFPWWVSDGGYSCVSWNVSCVWLCWSVIRLLQWHSFLHWSDVFFRVFLDSSVSLTNIQSATQKFPTFKSLKGV